MEKESILELNKISETVREMEDNYTRGNVTISEYVTFDMYQVINTIEAYLNSRHISGQYDSLGREKPFFNICVSASNIWYRATDIDRKNIRIKAKKNKDRVDSFLLNVHVQNWMDRENFGQSLNEWGRVLARYGSAVVKFVEADGKLNISVIPWNRLILDPIDFENNPHIEVLELTEAQLRARGYDKKQVEALCSAVNARKTLKGLRKDNKSNYIKLYEVHGLFPLSWLTNKEKDSDEYVQQMYVFSYVATGKKNEYKDYLLYKGREEKDPYEISHLIKEDGRALAIGAVEHLFQSQWMVNHSEKAIKDQLDLASKLIFQTSDGTFVGQNALTAIENGDILITAINQPLQRVANDSHDVTSLLNMSTTWKSLGNEITGISESMLGVSPKSGTPWRQTESLLQESYSLFELMTENKGLYLENWFRGRIIPHIKKTQLKHAKEISATLESYDINWIDSKYIKNYSISESNRKISDKIFNGEQPTPEEQQMMIEEMQTAGKQAMGEQGNQRFLKLSEISDKTWAEQFKDLEYDVDVDVTGESKDYQAMMATFSTALQTVMTPGFEQNERAKMIVDKILDASGHLSPIELSQIKTSPMPSQMGGQSSGEIKDTTATVL